MSGIQPLRLCCRIRNIYNPFCSCEADTFAMCPYKQQIFNQLSNIHCRDDLNKSVRDCEIKKHDICWLKALQFISLGQRPRYATHLKKRSAGANGLLIVLGESYLKVLWLLGQSHTNFLMNPYYIQQMHHIGAKVL